VYATHIEDGEFKSRLDDPFDDLMLWYLNDEYVHAPGHSWYKDSCSPALGRYSFPEDQGIYPDTESEMAARFPHVGLVAGKGDGVPYSVFMPVDNLARFWYRSCMTTQHPVSLGPVLHAIQDAAVPHHAAGYMGNWHADYERALNNWLTGEGPTAGTSWCDGDFEEAVCKLVREWNQDAPQPPTRLDRDKDLETPPAKNWRIDRMVTRVALHGYHQYAETYKHFRLGWSGVDLVSLAELTRKALAMSVLALIEANEETVLTLYVGSKVSDEFHRTGCRWVGLMNEDNKVQPLTLSIAQAKGLNGCHHCLRRYDTG